MSGKEPGQSAGQGIDDIHLGRGRVDLHGSLPVVAVELLQGASQGMGAAGDGGSGRIGLVFTAAGDGHLNQGRGQRGDNHHRQGCHGIAVFVIAPAAEDKSPLGHGCQVADGACHYRCHGADQDVPVTDMAQFMGNHSLQFLPAQYVHDAAGDGDGGMLRITAGGKGVGRGIVHQVDPRFGNIGLPGQVFHQTVQFRGLIKRDLPGPVHFKSEFVAVPVGKEIESRCYQQSENHALLTGHQAAADHQQSGEGGHQHKCFYSVHYPELCRNSGPDRSGSAIRLFTRKNKLFPAEVKRM